MSLSIEIHVVPDEIHRILAARAAEAGLSLSAYLRNKLCRDALLPAVTGKPTLEEMLARLEQLEPVHTATDPIDIIREARGPI